MKFPNNTDQFAYDLAAMALTDDARDYRAIFWREQSNRTFADCYERPGQWVTRRAEGEVRAQLQVCG